MKNQILTGLLKDLTGKLQNAYGYVGVMEGDDIAILNTDDGQGNDIRIEIKVAKE